MKITKLSRKRVEFNFRHGGYRIRQVVSLEDLAAWLLARRDQIIEGDLQDRVGPKGPITLSVFAEQHYREFARQHQPKSWGNEWSRVRCLTELLGARRLHEITERDLESISAYGRDRGLRPASINRLVRRLTNILRAAQRTGWLRRGAAIPEFNMLDEDNERDRILSDMEARLLLAHARHPTMRSILLLALNTGLRRSELAALRWSEVDVEEGWVYVRRAKNSRPRQVPLNSKGREALVNIPVPMQDARVFDVSAGWISAEFARVAKTAGVQGACFHDTRRTFISRALKLGVPEDLVRRIVGHRTHETISRYAVFGATVMAEMAERVATGGKSGQQSGHVARSVTDVEASSNRQKLRLAKT